MCEQACSRGRHRARPRSADLTGLSREEMMFDKEKLPSVFDETVKRRDRPGAPMRGRRPRVGAAAGLGADDAVLGAELTDRFSPACPNSCSGTRLHETTCFASGSTTGRETGVSRSACARTEFGNEEGWRSCRVVCGECHAVVLAFGRPAGRGRPPFYLLLPPMCGPTPRCGARCSASSRRTGRLAHRRLRRPHAGVVPLLSVLRHRRRLRRPARHAAPACPRGPVVRRGRPQHLRPRSCLPGGAVPHGGHHHHLRRRHHR